MSIIHPQIAIDRIRMTADFHQREIERQVDDLIARTDARIEEEIRKSRQEYRRKQWSRIMKDFGFKTPDEMIMGTLVALVALHVFRKYIKTKILDDL